MYPYCMKVRVRFAPSPTGNLHVGGARTALFNWLFTHHYGGEFILRIEDTDLERSKDEYEDNILDGLRWLGITWDNKQLYRQTERIPLYRKYLDGLLSAGLAFWCHHSIDELEAERKEQEKRKEHPRHICSDKGTERAKQPGGLIRLAVDAYSKRNIVFNDLVRGKVVWQEGYIGDLSLAKDLDTPLYNFAVVVDDVDMGITHVIRGEEHISNTPKQILIYEALGVKMPQFAHLPLILNPDKTKLSKRTGSTSVTDYRKDYLPEALVNFLGFLGYTFDREILSIDDMAKQFDIAKMHLSGAVFNVEKLNWLNAQYVKRLSPKEFKHLAHAPDLPDAAVPLITERLERLSDVEQFDFFWKTPEYEAGLLLWKKASTTTTKLSLERIHDMLEQLDFSDANLLRERLDALSSKDRGAIYWPLRAALSGEKASPDPIDIALSIGKDETLDRISLAIKKLRS